jgi:hypothetical protein
MQKYNFYNYKFIANDLEIKKPQIENNRTDTRVNINKLLNRVKINKKNESKEKAIFFGFAFLIISLMSIFVTIVR